MVKIRKNLLGLVVILLLCLIIAYQISLSQIKISEVNFSGFKLNKIEATGVDTKSEKALLIHGFQCNARMMLALAKVLALNGVTSYLFDLPGHGVSDKPFSHEVAKNTVLLLTKELAKVDNKAIHLVAHSYGAELAVYTSGKSTQVASLSLVGPTYAKGLSSKDSQRVKVLVAEKDPLHIKEAAEKLAFDLSTSEESIKPIVISDAGHIGLLLNKEVAKLVFRLITKGEIDQTKFSFVSEKVFGVFAVILTLLLLAYVSSRLSSFVEFGESALFAKSFWPFFVALLVSSLICSKVNILSFLRLHEGAKLASVLLVCGNFALVVHLLFNSKAISFSRINCAHSLIIGVILFFVAYLTLAATIGGSLYELSLFSNFSIRTTRWVLLFVFLTPFFVIAQSFVFSLLSNRGALYRGVALGLLAAFIFALPVVGVVFFDSSLSRFIGAYAGLFVFCGISSSIFNHYFRSVLPGSVFASLFISWITAVGFIHY